MYLIPTELSLTVGVGSAVFFLGLAAWWRNRRAVGNILFGFMAVSLAVWILADWLLLEAAPFIPLLVLGKLIFFLSVAFGPAVTMHASAYLAGLDIRRPIKLVYIASTICFYVMLSGFLMSQFSDIPRASEVFMQSTAGWGLIMYLAAILFTAYELQPLTVRTTVSSLERRRAVYGVVVLMLFALAGSAQLFVGPIPPGFVIPALGAAFLLISLMSFMRAAFLDVEFGILESFVLLLAAFATVLLLRAEDRSDFWVISIGVIAVGVFGFLALRAVRGERHKRMYLEAANRELKMLEAAKSDFVDMVSHQLRSPLGAIRSSAALLHDGDYGPVSDKAKEAAANIQDTATRLLSLSETFLNASRLEMGKYRSQPVRTDVRREIAEILAEMSLAAGAKGLVLKSEIAEDLPKEVVLDHEVLENVLFNLVDNAVKYTDRGSVIISCQIDPKHLILSVRDTGQGFTHEECADFFKKFQRGKLGHQHQSDGTGLGLFVVRQLIEAIGGSVSAVCRGVGEGAQFIAKFPYKQV